MEIPTKHFISRDLYCAGKDSTWEFLEDVMKEVCDLFPGKYIHIGGDEAKYDRWKKCPRCQARIKELGLKSEKELQGWMTRRIEKVLQKRDKQIIGWDEILGCGISTSAGVMTWHRPRTAGDGAKRGNPVVMALTGHCYFDAPESRLPGERPGATWIKPISLRKAYEWDPMPAGLSGDAAKNILGAQGCVWSDQFLHKPFLADKPGEGTARSEQYIEYFSLPRMAALAEVTWTAKDKRNWDDFASRMGCLMARYSTAEYHYRMPLPRVAIEKQSDGSARITARSPVEGGRVHYTVDGSGPTADSPRLTEPVTVKNPADFRAVSVGPMGMVKSLVYSEQALSSQGGGRGRGRGGHGRGRGGGHGRGRGTPGGNYGAKIGEWKPGVIGSGKAKTALFDATGHIDRAGTYVVTFIYTRGEHRLDIDSVEVVRNERDVVAKDVHHGFTGGQRKDNQYTVKVADYETGASYKIRAAIYGDIGDDSNGVVYIRRIK
jgi:hexosaminidase